ncbi:MAG: Do family serine endopeptidase [Bacteroidetes bacterium]|nr:Do family serine endopeptidase [Bacteroidota bacterium]
MKKIASVFFIASIGGITALGLNHLLKDETANHPLSNYLSSPTPTQYVNMPGATVENSVDFTAAADLTVHSVVNVKTTYSVDYKNQYYYDPFRDFFGQRQPRQQEAPYSTGSGVIISQDGYIVTNNHVIDNGEKIEITLNDKRTYTADVIGKDPTTDLALLKIKETNLPFVAYGNSDNVKVGEWVLAVGNPFNLTSTVTAGIVSAKGRNINLLDNDPTKGLYPIESFIQTDAAVNPGNSGGALVNTKGELVGINSAIASNTGSYTGYSFAIPVNIARKVVADLLEFGEVQRAFIGVSIRDLDSKLAQEKSINELKGVYVNGLTTGGSAEEAGIKEGDVITKIGDVAINKVAELQEQIGRYRPGDKINVTLKRNNQEKILSVILKNKNGNTDVVEKPKIEVVSALGATFEDVNDADKKKLGIENGLRISKLSAGKLLSAGIKEGFIITGVDKKKISSVEDIKSALENKKGGVLIEGVYPNGMRAYYGFGL